MRLDELYLWYLGEPASYVGRPARRRGHGPFGPR